MSGAESLASGTPATARTVSILRTLLGDDVILLPVKYGAKNPLLPKWQQLESSVMENPNHLARLDGNNIGVLLGSASGGLVSFDFDDREHGQLFFNANPALERTLVTRASRGFNFWVRLAGEYPESYNITTAEGKPVGEFRASGRQTVIFGRHPSGKPYRPLKPINTPITLKWSDIVWPPAFAPLARSEDAYARLVCENGQPVWVSESGAVTLNQPFFVAKFAVEHPVIFQSGRGFYEYQLNTGIWRRISDDRIKRMFSDDLWQYAQEANVPKIATKRTAEDVAVICLPIHVVPVVNIYIQAGMPRTVAEKFLQTQPKIKSPRAVNYERGSRLVVGELEGTEISF